MDYALACAFAKALALPCPLLIIIRDSTPSHRTRHLSPDSPDRSLRILPGTPDLGAGSAAYANRHSPVGVGVVGESKTNSHPAM